MYCGGLCSMPGHIWEDARSDVGRVYSLFFGRGRISIASFTFITNASCQRFFGFEGSGLRFQHSIMRVQSLTLPSYSIPPWIATSSKVLLYVNNFHDEKRSSALRKTEKVRGHSCACECSCSWFIARLVILLLLQYSRWSCRTVMRLRY